MGTRVKMLDQGGAGVSLTSFLEEEDGARDAEWLCQQ